MLQEPVGLDHYSLLSILSYFALFPHRRSIADRLLKLSLFTRGLSIGNIPPDRMILHYRADRWEHPLLIETYDEMAASADRDLLMPLGAQ